jgi:hypothetical protein
LASWAVFLLTAVSISRRRRTAIVFLVILQYSRGRVACENSV